MEKNGNVIRYPVPIKVPTKPVTVRQHFHDIYFDREGKVKPLYQKIAAKAHEIIMCMERAIEYDESCIAGASEFTAIVLFEHIQRRKQEIDKEEEVLKQLIRGTYTTRCTAIDCPEHPCHQSNRGRITPDCGHNHFDLSARKCEEPTANACADWQETRDKSSERRLSGERRSSYMSHSHIISRRRRSRLDRRRR